MEVSNFRWDDQRRPLLKGAIGDKSFSSKKVKQVPKRIIKFISSIIIIVTVKQEVLINSNFQLLLLE